MLPVVVQCKDGDVERAAPNKQQISVPYPDKSYEHPQWRNGEQRMSRITGRKPKNWKNKKKRCSTFRLRNERWRPCRPARSRWHACRRGFWTLAGSSTGCRRTQGGLRSPLDNRHFGRHEKKNETWNIIEWVWGGKVLVHIGVPGDNDPKSSSQLKLAYLLHLGHTGEVNDASRLDSLVIKVELTDRLGGLVKVVKQAQLLHNG